ncbi:hypothetical protein BC829DRAFT_17763 [Chytridium lagenaria]|nr:hypothetical protein BC829DRAFT_17763 [Chytridium lagenaria]
MVGGSPGRTHNRTPNRGGNIGQMDGRQGNRGQSFGEGHVRQKVYEDYMPLLKVNEGLAAKTLHQAVLRINKKDPHDAYVTCDAYTEDVYICGKIARNRAFDGDLVVIEILDGDEKKALVERSDDRKENKRREDEAKLKKVVVGGEVEEVEVLVGAEEAEAIPRIYGKVVCILEQRVNQVFIGTLSIDPPHRNGARGPQKPSPGPVSSSINTIWFKPVSQRIPLPSSLIFFFSRIVAYHFLLFPLKTPQKNTSRTLVSI